MLLLKQVDEDWLKQLSEVFGSRLALQPAGGIEETRVEFRNRNTALVSTPIPVWNTHSRSYLLQMTESRDLYDLLMDEIWQIGWAAIFIFLLFLLLLLFLLERSLIRPIGAIRNRILHIAGPRVIARVTGRPDWNEENALRSLEIIVTESCAIIEEQHRRLNDQREEYRRQSLRDPLTNLYNRRGLNNLFSDFVGDQPALLCLMILDVDHFKQVNDRFGHETGDRVIESIALLVNQFWYKKVLAARTGGEEFCLVFKATDFHVLQSSVAAFRQGFSQATATLTGQRGETLSLGSIRLWVDASVSLGDLMKCADDALYEAKLRRDNWVHYSQLNVDGCNEAQPIPDLKERRAFSRTEYPGDHCSE